MSLLNEIERRALRMEERREDGRFEFGEAVIKWKGKSEGLFHYSFEEEMDVDLGAFMLDEQANILDMIHYGKNKTACGGLHFDGDSHHKQFNQDDGGQTVNQRDKIYRERIELDLGRIVAKTYFIVFAAILYNDEGFDKLDNGQFFINNLATEKTLLNVKIKQDCNYPACILAMLKFNRYGRNWSAKWIEEYRVANAFSQLNSAVQEVVLLNQY